jgi:hypothetical protein
VGEGRFAPDNFMVSIRRIININPFYFTIPIDLSASLLLAAPLYLLALDRPALSRRRTLQRLFLPVWMPGVAVPIALYAGARIANILTVLGYAMQTQREYLTAFRALRFYTHCISPF